MSFDSSAPLPTRRLTARSSSRLSHDHENRGKSFHGFLRECVNDGEKLEQIDPPLAALIGRDERLWLVKASSQFILGDAGLPADLGEVLAERDVSLARQPRHGWHPGNCGGRDN